jgi:hypothetical protein
MKRYACAVCQREIGYAGALPALYPFCSPRCRLVDLGRWLREDFAIDRELTPEDRADPDIASQLDAPSLASPSHAPGGRVLNAGSAGSR